MVAVYQKASSTLREVLIAETAAVLPPANDSRASHLDKVRPKTAHALSLIAIFVIPLVAGGVSGVLLEGAMRFANIKKGPSYVMLHAPYSTFIPSRFQAKQSPQAPDYTTFGGIDVMFSGIGQKSVIEFKDGRRARRLEIPNESILIVPR